MMNERLFRTIVSCHKYLIGVDRYESDRYGIEVLQNLASTALLEIEEQRKLGITIPEPSPALARFLRAGMQATTEEADHGKVNNENYNEASSTNSTGETTSIT